MIKPDSLPEQTKGGIHVPQIVKEKPSTGMVVLAGPMCEIAYAGAKVHFPRNAASSMSSEGVDYFLISEERLLYVE